MDKVYKVPYIEGKKTDKLIEVSVPGSKSITNRALLIAALAKGTSILHGCLSSDDSRYFLECLKKLGFPIEESEDGTEIKIVGFGGNILAKNAEIYVGSAGTAARFLVAMLAFSDGEYIVNSSEQMKKRPMAPLINTLRAAGAKVECLEEEGHFPLKINGIYDLKLIPDEIVVNIDKSSQFLSALLIAAGTINKQLKIKINGSHGLSYVDMTVEMMKSFGVTVIKYNKSGEISYFIDGFKNYQPKEYYIEPDMSAAAYFYAFGAITGNKIAVKGVKKNMLQGDVKFLEVLEKMGCKLNDDPSSNLIYIENKSQKLNGINVDMSSFSDQALTLAAIAPFADSRVTITGIEHIKLQECDRVNAIIHNLKSLGINAKEEGTGVVIEPGLTNGCEIETYEDHRVAMAFALTGLRTKDVTILNPDCCKKTFKNYFSVLDEVIEQLH
jgi:3-phosphoshikimate 1-carboxyvinyltransferase